MEPIYLDYAATTPVRSEVREAMEPFHTEAFGNPSSSHRWGREAQAALERARGEVAEALGARRREILFVRGGTESDNLALLGRADDARCRGEHPCVVTTRIEHKAVLDAARSVEEFGGRTVLLPVDRAGRVEMPALEDALEARPCVVSIMWVNNEVGTIQSMPEIAELCASAGVPLHSDAVQAVGKIPVSLDEIGLTLMSISGHKIYGPKSSGALFVREGTDLHARIHGGGQENGLRPGTQDVAGAVGLATAIRFAVTEQAELQTRYRELRSRMLGRLRQGLPDLIVNGQDADISGHVLSIGLRNLPSEMLMVSLDMEGLAVSGGSACQSGSGRGSHVLEAMYGADTPDSAIRYSFGRATTPDQVDRAADITTRVVNRLRGAGVPT